MVNNTQWLDHVKSVKKENPEVNYSQVMKLASESYVKEPAQPKDKPKLTKPVASDGLDEMKTSDLKQEIKPRTKKISNKEASRLAQENKILKMEALLKKHNLILED